MGIRIGTRKSPLALAQTGILVEAWARLGVSVELVPISTEGDERLDRALHLLGGKGAFTTALETALLDGAIDVAVHSLKDLPTDVPDGLVVGAVARRGDVRDCVVAAAPLSLDNLPAGARIGTSSLRRQALLASRWPAVTVVPVRGNLQTRWDKMDDLRLAGLVLAAAGVERLHWEDRVAQYLPADYMVPAPGQGALAMEVRQDDQAARELVRLLQDDVTERATRAERAILAALGGNCQIPLGAWAAWVEDAWQVRVFVARPDGSGALERSWRGFDLDSGTAWIVEELRAAGAETLVRP